MVCQNQILLFSSGCPRSKVRPSLPPLPIPFADRFHVDWTEHLMLIWTVERRDLLL